MASAGGPDCAALRSEVVSLRSSAFADLACDDVFMACLNGELLHTHRDLLIRAAAQADVIIKGSKGNRRALGKVLGRFPACRICSRTVFGHTRAGCPDHCASHCACFHPPPAGKPGDLPARDFHAGAFDTVDGDRELSPGALYGLLLGGEEGSVRVMVSNRLALVHMRKRQTDHALFKVRVSHDLVPLGTCTLVRRHALS